MFTLLKKDIKLFFKDKRGVLLTFLLPIVLITIFAVAFGGLGANDEDDKFDLVVAYSEDSEQAETILAHLDTVSYIELHKFSQEECNKKLKAGHIPAYLNLTTDSTGAIQLELRYDEARAAEAGVLQSVINREVSGPLKKQVLAISLQNFVQEELGVESAYSAILLDKVDSLMAVSSGAGQIATYSEVGDKDTSGLALIQAVAGTTILMLLFSVSALGAEILEEKEKGTLKRLLFAPISPSSILFSKMLSALWISILQLIAMFAFSQLVFGLPVTEYLPGVTIMILSTAIAVASFGIFLAAVCKTRRQAAGLGTLVILIMSALGGSMMPLYFMPDFMQDVAVVSINYWSIQGFFDIFWRDLPLSQVVPNAAILVAVGVVMTLISFSLFKKHVKHIG